MVQTNPHSWLGQYSPVVASDDNTTSTSLLTLLHLVHLMQALALVRGLELLGELIIANTASVDH